MWKHYCIMFIFWWFSKMVVVIYLMIWHFIYNNIFFCPFESCQELISFFLNSAQLPLVSIIHDSLQALRFIIYDAISCFAVRIIALYNIVLQKTLKEKKNMTIMNCIVIKVLSVKMVHLRFHMFWKIKPVILKSFTYSLSDKFNKVAYSNL